ncbi:MAG: hypothetical protein AB7H92_14755 [Microbacteriaceae bacterium]
MSTRSVDANVVRARRFELIDGAGRVRARLATTAVNGDGSGGDAVALELLGETGVSLTAGPHVAQLMLEVGGNQVLIVEAGIQRAGVAGGSAITLCDGDGVPIVSCRVDPAGHVDVELASELG